ncbi:DUF6134 family protein [Rhodovulum sp. DZ06]|uniref:DUF6134 family protein n=1 Tax=Rhodovulum sp. DZ06 TaxID=3425126 RepID=UPI003D32F879
MILDRRAFLAGTCCVALTPPAALAASDRRFAILRGSDEVGAQRLSVRRTPEGIEARTEIDIAVRFLGIAAYRYTLSSTELWQGGRLVALDASSDDDGEAGFVRARAEGERLRVDGSGFEGTLDRFCVPTSYWSKDFTRRRTWISTQTGVPLKVACATTGAVQVDGPRGPIAAERWLVTGELELELYYAGDEWVGSAFEAGGEQAAIAPRVLAGELPRLGET